MKFKTGTFHVEMLSRSSHAWISIIDTVYQGTPRKRRCVLKSFPKSWCALKSEERKRVLERERERERPPLLF